MQFWPVCSEGVHILDFGFTFLYRVNYGGLELSEKDKMYGDGTGDGALLRLDEFVERTHHAMIEHFSNLMPNVVKTSLTLSENPFGLVLTKNRCM